MHTRKQVNMQYSDVQVSHQLPTQIHIYHYYKSKNFRIYKITNLQFSCTNIFEYQPTFRKFKTLKNSQYLILYYRVALLAVPQSLTYYRGAVKAIMHSWSP